MAVSFDQQSCKTMKVNNHLLKFCDGSLCPLDLIDIEVDMIEIMPYRLRAPDSYDFVYATCG